MLTTDLASLLRHPAQETLNGDGSVGTPDLLSFLSNFGVSCE